ncbi:oligosaccharide flippase family protein [Skermania sp. ID1734]|nr:oligosaccharide flippase family protein [Skermania sp. ID1734]
MRDVGFVSFGKYGQYAVALVTLPFTARILGPHGMGLLAVSMSAYFVGSLVTDMGITPYLAARVDKPGLPQLRGNYAAVRAAILTALAALFLATGLTAFTHSVLPAHVPLLTLGLLAGGVSSAGDDWVLVGQNRFGTLVGIQSAGRLAYLVALFALLPLVRSPYTAMFCLLGSSLIPVLWSWLITIRDYGRPHRPHRQWRLLRLGAPILTARMLENTYEQAAATVFSPALSPTSMGLFSASDRPVQAAGSLLDGIGWSMLPRMARFDDLRGAFRMVGIVASIGAAAAAVMWMLAPWVVPVLFGQDFDGAIVIMRVEVWVLPGMAAASFISTAILPVYQDTRGAIYGAGIGATITFTAFAIALQNHSAMTLVVAIVTAESTVALFYLGRVRYLQTRAEASQETVAA